MPDFSEAKVGDRIWSDRKGWGEVVKNRQASDLRSLTVAFPLDGPYYYWKDGKRNLHDVTPELHWDKIHYEEPEPPKNGEAWVDFFIRRSGEIVLVGLDSEPIIFESKEGALFYRTCKPHVCFVDSPVRVNYPRLKTRA